jgi:hypothetical protein
MSPLKTVSVDELTVVGSGSSGRVVPLFVPSSPGVPRNPPYIFVPLMSEKASDLATAESVRTDGLYDPTATQISSPELAVTADRPLCRSVQAVRPVTSVITARCGRFDIIDRGLGDLRQSSPHKSEFACWLTNRSLTLELKLQSSAQRQRVKTNRRDKIASQAVNWWSALTTPAQRSTAERNREQRPVNEKTHILGCRLIDRRNHVC